MEDLIWLIYQARIALICLWNVLSYILQRKSKNKSFRCITLLFIDDEVLVKVDRSNTHRRDIYLRRILDECMK